MTGSQASSVCVAPGGRCSGPTPSNSSAGGGFDERMAPSHCSPVEGGINGANGLNIYIKGDVRELVFRETDRSSAGRTKLHYEVLVI